MDYNSLIDEAKRKIDNYRFDDSIYEEIYNRAASGFNSAFTQSSQAVDDEHNRGRQRAVGQSALETKSLSADLASRGLATSGESAMLRINQSLSLANALSALQSSALQSKTALASERDKSIASLQTEIASKKAAAMENEKQALYERLAHLERLGADERDRRERLAANETEWREKLTASENEWQTKLAAGENEWQTKLASSNAEWQAKLAASMAAAGAYGGASGGYASAGASDGKADSGQAKFDPMAAAKAAAVGTSVNDPYKPSMNATATASNLITKITGSGTSVGGEASQKLIRTELARLIANTNISADYTREVLFALKSKGFSIDFDLAVAQSGTVKTAIQFYDKTYEETLNRLVSEGMPRPDARKQAITAAEKRAKDTIQSSGLTDKQKRAALAMMGI